MPAVQELFDLTGRVAIVTGGAGHLGTAMSEALAEAGAHVVITSRTLEKCRNLADRLSEAHQECLALRVDINDEDSIVKMVEDAVRKFGRIDILVNNAISMRTNPQMEEMTVEEFESALHGNPTAYFCCVKACIPHMRRAGGGSVVNIASMYGMIAPHFQIYHAAPQAKSPVNYHAAKGGVLQMTRYMASYLAPHKIRVNGISPGPFPKPAVVDETPAFEEELARQNPMNRIGQPWELKGTVVYLASEASSYVTGQNLVVDGGWTIW